MACRSTGLPLAATPCRTPGGAVAAPEGFRCAAMVPSFMLHAQGSIASALLQCKHARLLDGSSMLPAVLSSDACVAEEAAAPLDPDTALAPAPAPAPAPPPAPPAATPEAGAGSAAKYPSIGNCSAANTGTAGSRSAGADMTRLRSAARCAASTSSGLYMFQERGGSPWKAHWLCRVQQRSAAPALPSASRNSLHASSRVARASSSRFNACWHRPGVIEVGQRQRM